MTWSLIVFLMFSGSLSQSSTPGFKSKAACLKASEAYLHLLTAQDPQHHLVFRAVCVSSAGKD